MSLTAADYALAALFTVSVVAQVSNAMLFVHQTSLNVSEVFTFGVKGPNDVELFRQIVRRRTLPTKSRTDTVRYPTQGATTKNIVTCVVVTVPRRHLFARDEVRIIGGGPGLNYVAVSIRGWSTFVVDYTVIVYGQELQGGRSRQRSKQSASSSMPTSTDEDSDVDGFASPWVSVSADVTPLADDGSSWAPT